MIDEKKRMLVEYSMFFDALSAHLRKLAVEGIVDLDGLHGMLVILELDVKRRTMRGLIDEVVAGE